VGQRSTGRRDLELTTLAREKRGKCEKQITGVRKLEGGGMQPKKAWGVVRREPDGRERGYLSTKKTIY